MTELEHNRTTTRPQIKESLRETSLLIRPEFDKTAHQTFTDLAAALASPYTEKARRRRSSKACLAKMGRNTAGLSAEVLEHREPLAR